MWKVTNRNPVRIDVRSGAISRVNDDVGDPTDGSARSSRMEMVKVTTKRGQRKPMVKSEKVVSREVVAHREEIASAEDLVVLPIRMSPQRKSPKVKRRVVPIRKLVTVMVRRVVAIVDAGTGILRATGRVDELNATCAFGLRTLLVR